MKNEDLLSESRLENDEQEEQLKEIDEVMDKAAKHWDNFHKYDKYPTQGKQEFIDGFVVGWFQRAGLQ